VGLLRRSAGEAQERVEALAEILRELTNADLWRVPQTARKTARPRSR
jgi:two-component sensor histidine kinase